jgi:hypothetical protein
VQPCDGDVVNSTGSAADSKLVFVLPQFKEEARQMVSQMVEMERSYLTAEVFREILSSSHATDDLYEDAGVRVRFPISVAS